MIAPHTREQAKRFAYFDRAGWSAGWDIGNYRGERMISRFGSFQTTRSHLSFLPDRRIGVVVQATGELGSAVTDIIAALVYDLELGVADARQQAGRRLNDLAATRTRVVREAVVNDSLREARRQPPPHPLTSYLGTYQAPGYGSISFANIDDRLAYSWGLWTGAAEALDAIRNLWIVNVGGTAMTVEFVFEGTPSRATSIKVNGIPFQRHDN